MTAGTAVGAWVEAEGPASTVVAVVTKRRVATNLVTSLTETTFHKRFAKGVGRVKAGKPLPPTLPAGD